MPKKPPTPVPVSRLKIISYELWQIKRRFEIEGGRFGVVKGLENAVDEILDVIHVLELKV